MSDQKTTKPAEELPDFIKKAPELLPVYDWWKKEGKSSLTIVCAAALIWGGWHFGRQYLRARDANAAQALVSAFDASALEEAVAKYGGAKAGPALRLRLAKSYFDAERYDEALAVYEKYAAEAKSGDAFVDVAVVGRAFALEGLKRYDEAHKAFAAYAGDAAKADSFLHFTAQLGAARTKALSGDREGALKDFEALKAAAKDERMTAAQIDEAIDAVKRFDARRSAHSLFDAADQAAQNLAKDEAAQAPAAKPAAPAPAKAPAAPAAKNPAK